MAYNPAKCVWLAWFGKEGGQGVVSSLLREQTDTKAHPFWGAFEQAEGFEQCYQSDLTQPPLIQGGFRDRCISGGLQTSQTHAALIRAL